MPPFILKLIIDILIEPLTFLINLSLEDNMTKTVWQMVSNERKHNKASSANAELSVMEFKVYFTSVTDNIPQSTTAVNIEPLTYLNKTPKPAGLLFMTPILEVDVKKAILYLRKSHYLDY
nr:unnamed protein product [Callosobruchus analis]